MTKVQSPKSKVQLMMTAATFAACACAWAAGWKMDQTLKAENYEADGARTANPELITQNVAPGLLVATRMGAYKATGRTTLEKTGFDFVTPAGEFAFARSFRIYGFGRGERVSGTLETKFVDGVGKAFAIEVVHDAAKPNLVCKVADKQLEVPYASLPVEFLFTANRRGDGELSALSLADSSFTSVKFPAYYFANHGGYKFAVETTLVPAKEGAEAEVTLDELRVGNAVATKASKFPAKIEPLAEFDPEKAGWKKVFEENFDGTTVDETKWRVTSADKDKLVQVKDGVLGIGVDFKPGETNRVSRNLRTASLWTKESFGYGYYEARVKFTHQNGWWAAFWLYGDDDTNPFLDGFEIDIFEDYYTRRRNPDGTNHKTIDHNLHLYAGSMASLKSWNYNSELPGTLDDWYRIGCKWTPFEISYYYNGKLMASRAWHSAWQSVTFDAFSHGAGFAPLHAIVSGQIMKSSWNKNYQDLSKATFPDWYYVDSVKVWEYPDVGERAPQVKWLGDVPKGTEAVPVKPGTNLVFRVEVTPAKDGAPIKNVYLFDTAYPLACKSEPPYVFEVPFTEAHYRTTRFMEPGRQNEIPKFEVPHAFAVFAQDEKGNVGHTAPIVYEPKDKSEEFMKSRPYKGKPHPVPGAISPELFDEGGAGVAYCDSDKGNGFAGKTHNGVRVDDDVDCTPGSVGGVRTGEWINYTIDVAEAGEYMFKFNYGTPNYGKVEVRLSLDGDLIAIVPLKRHDADHFGIDTVAEQKVKLPKGVHVLRLWFRGQMNFRAFEFTR